MKEQEFLTLTQGDMSVLECERRFHDLSMFAPYHVPTKEHMLDRFQDRLRQELKYRLITLQFRMMRNLT
jgi:hypothetical protein